MKIPEEVKIGPYRYPVKRPKTILSDDGTRALWGRIDYQPKRVKILRGIPDDRAFVTLLHEALHGIDDLVSLGLSEDQITRLAPALAAFLVDNGMVEGD